MLHKYWHIAKTSWENGFVYRLNFVMWRVRQVVQLLAVYFLWLAVLKQNPTIFDYSRTQMLTYILGTSVIRSLVFSSRSVDAQTEIATGDLNNHLVKPMGYFKYWFARDAADKLLNLLFLAVELTLIVILLKPPLFIQSDLVTLAMFAVASILAMVMYFYFSFLISMSTFWLPEHNGWPQRFFVFMLLEFFSGGLFPLDILPKPIFAVAKSLPTAHFLHTPLQIYLGRITGLEALQTVGIMALWIVLFWQLAAWVFRRGLKIYGAYGR